MLFVRSCVLVAMVCALGCGGDELLDGDEGDARGRDKRDSGVAAVADGGVEHEDAAALADTHVPSVPPRDAAMGEADATPVDAAAPVSEPDAAVVVPDANVTPEPEPCPSYWRDADGDGFGAPGTAITSCTVPDGYVSNESDCYDLNWSAKPGSTGPFVDHRGDGSWDYNCDGVETIFRTKLAVCPEFSEEDHACPPNSFWSPGFSCDFDTMSEAWIETMKGWAKVVPGCGEKGTYGANVRWSPETKRYTCDLEPSYGSNAPNLPQTCF